MESAWWWISWGLGLDGQDLTVWRVVLRACLIYSVGIFLVRLGGKRFVGKFSAFDIIMAIMIGSILSRAIVTADGFLPHVAAAFVLTAMHSLFARMSFRWDWFGTLIKGKPHVLVRDGEIQWKAMASSQISEKDLMSALRETANERDLHRVKEMRLERSGNISVILRADD